MATLRIASDGVTPMQSRGLRAGRRVAPPPQVEPARWTHAYEEGSSVTLCGREVAALHTQEFHAREFARINPYLRCRSCMSIADLSEERADE